MNTALSTKRMYAKSEVNVSKEIILSIVALVGGILLIVLGAAADFTPAAMIGFFSSATSFLYLNARLWGAWFEKHPEAFSRQVNEALRNKIS